MCGSGDVNCHTQAALVWQDELDAAEEFYDRTAACSFTTFPGYEWTNNLGGYNLHRNVIFRNAEVPALPTSYYEEPHVEGLYTKLENDCLNVSGNCDFLAIPLRDDSPDHSSLSTPTFSKTRESTMPEPPISSQPE